MQVAYNVLFGYHTNIMDYYNNYETLLPLFYR